MTKEMTQGFSLREASCAVIGVGGLGCNIAVHLAGMGVKRLILCDFDKVSEGNLNRQFLYTREDIGRKKVLVASERLKAYAPDVSVTAIPERVKRDNIPEELKCCDMIFLATDNKSSREAVFLFSKDNAIPLMMGGIDGFYGKAYLYLPGISPCPVCAGMLDGKKAKTNISTTAGITGSLEAQTGAAYLITGDSTLSGVLTVCDRTKRKRDDKT